MLLVYLFVPIRKHFGKHRKKLQKRAGYKTGNPFEFQ
jgi:hypothetical protein